MNSSALTEKLELLKTLENKMKNALTFLENKRQEKQKAIEAARIEGELNSEYEKLKEILRKEK